MQHTQQPWGQLPAAHTRLMSAEPGSQLTNGASRTAVSWNMNQGEKKSSVTMKTGNVMSGSLARDSRGSYNATATATATAMGRGTGFKASHSSLNTRSMKHDADEIIKKSGTPAFMQSNPYQTN